MCSLCKEQSILLRKTIQNMFFFHQNYVPFSTWTFCTLSSIKHPTAECWHLHAVPMLIIAFLLFENIVLLEEKHTHTHKKKTIN